MLGNKFVVAGTYSLGVNDLDDSSELAGISTLLDEDNAAKLNVLPLGFLDSDRHCYCKYLTDIWCVCGKGESDLSTQRQ